MTERHPVSEPAAQPDPPVSRASALAVGWIQAWKSFDMEWLRSHLAPDFRHTSPFGVLMGRDSYLETVEPLARKSVNELVIRDVVGDEDRAAIWFENRGADGVTPTCDWIFTEGKQIKEIHSFYDPAGVRLVLPESGQRRLEGDE